MLILDSQRLIKLVKSHEPNFVVDLGWYSLLPGALPLLTRIEYHTPYLNQKFQNSPEQWLWNYQLDVMSLSS